MTIIVPTIEMPNSDVTGLRFTSFEKLSTVSIAGSAFFESEETPKQHKTLYRESPLLTVSLHERGKTTPIKTLQLPVSHLFEFTGLKRG